MRPDRPREASSDPVSGRQEKIARAWQQAREGDPEQALQLSRQLVIEHGVQRNDLPLFSSALLVALRDHLNGKPVAAAKRLHRLIASNHQARMPQQILLTMMRDALDGRPEASRRSTSEPGRLVFGAGSGRSGSTTLSALLEAQPETCWSHEHPPVVPWGQDGRDQTEFHLARMALLANVYPVVADVAHWWLPKLPLILQAYPQSRCVIIRRDRTATVESFMRVKALHQPGGINHWMEHDGIRFRANQWDVSYPKFPVDDPEQALGLYWDRYYGLAERVIRRYPDQVRMFEIEALADPAGQADILRFCGYHSPVLLPGLHRNQDSVKDGKHRWHNPFGPSGRLRRGPGDPKVAPSMRTDKGDGI